MGTMNRKNMAATLATLALGQLFYLTAHADPMNTYCHMGVCMWQEIVSEEILSGNNIENGYLVMTRSVKFNTYHEGDYPKSYSSNMLKTKGFHPLMFIAALIDLQFFGTTLAKLKHFTSFLHLDMNILQQLSIFILATKRHIFQHLN